VDILPTRLVLTPLLLILLHATNKKDWQRLWTDLKPFCSWSDSPKQMLLFSLCIFIYSPLLFHFVKACKVLGDELWQYGNMWGQKRDRVWELVKKRHIQYKCDAELYWVILLFCLWLVISSYNNKITTIFILEVMRSDCWYASNKYQFAKLMIMVLSIFILNYGEFVPR